MTRYISTTDTAKLIRAQLKAKFPGVKFSVRSDIYSGGSSIRVGWTDGPTGDDVEAVTSNFAGGGFDGMIDLAYSVTAYLLPDGSAAFAQTSGTEGSRGVVPAGKAFMPAPGAERVKFGADYVFTDRTISAEFKARVMSEFERLYGPDRVASVGFDWQADRDFYAILNATRHAA